MATRDACLEKARKPTHIRGATLQQGRYVRNLEENDIAPRFERDPTKPPEFGLRVKPGAFKWKADDPATENGVSVNCLDCACSACCAVLLHPKAEQFPHALVIDLEQLSRELKMPLVVSYDPDPDGENNPCHYLLLPETKTAADLGVAIKRWCDDVFKPDRKIPKDSAQAHAERATYERVFQIVANVCKDPSPTPTAP
jgi:hypothetical protein